MDHVLRDLSRLTFLSEGSLASPHMEAFVLDLTAPLGDLSPYEGRVTVERGITLAKERLRAELLQEASEALVHLPSISEKQKIQAHNNVVSLFGRRAQ